MWERNCIKFILSIIKCSPSIFLTEGKERLTLSSSCSTSVILNSHKILRVCFILLICIVVLPKFGFAQYVLSEIEQTGFIATSMGMYATQINPAGLAIEDGDDGVLFSRIFSTESDDYQNNFLISMNDVGFSYQKDETELTGEDYIYECYQLSLSVGNEIIAVGNTTKWIRTEYHDKVKETPNSDIGLIFRPIGNFSLAMMVKNISEQEIITGFGSPKRNYVAGSSALLFDRHLVFNAEAIWNETTHNLDESVIKTGVNFYPIDKVNFILGWQREEDVDSHFWAGAHLIWGGISVGAMARTLDGEEIERITFVFRASLQSVQF